MDNDSKPTLALVPSPPDADKLPTEDELAELLSYTDILFSKWAFKFKNSGRTDDLDVLQTALRAYDKKSFALYSVLERVQRAEKIFKEEFLPELQANYVLGKGFYCNGHHWDEVNFMHQVAALAAHDGRWHPIVTVGPTNVVFNYINKEFAAIRERANVFLEKVDKVKGELALRKFIGFLRDIPEEKVDDLDLAAIKSMLWQVKRKARGHYFNNWPLMVIFTGGQGYAKTSALKALFMPINTLVCGSKSLSDFNNSFNTIDFSRYLVVPFDDMSTHVKYDVALLKRLVSENDYQHRNPAAKLPQKLDNISTLYGTANQSVAATIPDDTGARRWWEIDSPNRQATDTDIERLKTIPFEDCWLSVDGADEENPRTPFRAAMQVRQHAEMRHVSSLEEAVNSLLTFDASIEEADSAQLDEIYIFIREWYHTQDQRVPMKNALIRLLRRHGCQINNDNSRPRLRGIKKLIHKS